MKGSDLNEWRVVDPDNREDFLPQPYRLIDEVLSQTILHQLTLHMHRIEEKKKDGNYEGGVSEYLAQSIVDVQQLACLSSSPRHHNYMSAGDKQGNIYLLDLPKKIVFCKKELFGGRRVIHIEESGVTDGDSVVTVVGIVLNSHNKVYIVRYKYGQPKMWISQVVEVCPDQTDPNKLPYKCQFIDYARILCVFTLDGGIHFYRIPQPTIDLDLINKEQTIPLEEQQFKRRLRYPFVYAQLQGEPTTISQPLHSIKFPGSKVPPRREQLIQRMSKIDNPDSAESDIKKDPKKKEEKREQKKEEPLSVQLEYNERIEGRQVVLCNGQDSTPCYPSPKFTPFLWVLAGRAELTKKKEFQQGRYIETAERIAYGWTNTKEIKIASFLTHGIEHYPDHIYIQHHLTKIPPSFSDNKKTVLARPPSLTTVKNLRTISSITVTALSTGEEAILAAGMANGVVTLWSTNALTMLMNTDKHQASISSIGFFQGWKLISGSSQGEVHIDNILTHSNEMKRTNVFEAKQPSAITDMVISDVGVAFVMDSGANLRVYDLWRSEKIARVAACSQFAMAEGKGRRWLPSLNIQPAPVLYINNDFTAVFSHNWPNYSAQQLQEQPEKSEQLNAIIGNPFSTKGTSVHVIRNFEFLLHLFEGLENIYKKGYERRKVENLFSNLQFAQLYDRNFDIPDFGVAQSFKKGEKTSEVMFGGAINKTQFSSKSRERTMKDSSTNSRMSQGSRARGTKLTSQVLHPEKFLMQRRRLKKDEVMTQQRLSRGIRDMYRRQDALQTMLNSDLSKGFL